MSKSLIWMFVFSSLLAVGAVGCGGPKVAPEGAGEMKTPNLVIDPSKTGTNPNPSGTGAPK